MIEIAPSVLSFDHSQMRAAVSSLAEAGADWIHFDVMDGQFVPPITFGAKLVADLRSAVSTPFEVHLMTKTPEQHFDAFIQAGCRRVIFHAEATDHAHRLIQSLHEQGIEAGVAINPGTPACVLQPVADILDLALVMTVNPGWGGQQLIDSALGKVEECSKWCRQVEVDGGIDDSSIRSAYDAGARVFVAGNYLVKATDMAQAMRLLRERCAS